MKIAIFHELSFGGARRVVDEYAKLLSAHHKVDVYYVDHKEDIVQKKQNYSSYFFPFKPLPWKGHNWKKKLYKDTFELLKLRLLHKNIASLIEKKKYDVVFIHPSKYTQAPFLLSFLNTKTVYYCQEPLRIAYDPYLQKINQLQGLRALYEAGNLFLRKVIDKKNISHAQMLLSNSLFSQQTIKEAYGLDSYVCYLGVDIDLFSPKDTTKESDVLFIGATEPIEGYDLLKDATKISKKKWNIRVVSRNENGEGIKDEQLVEIINKSKIVVCLSHKEPFGLVAIEAGACGIPVIAVKEGGYIESILDGKTGLLIDRNPEQLATKINYLLDNPLEIKKLGKKAREHIFSFWSWLKSEQRLMKIFQNKV